MSENENSPAIGSFSDGIDDVEEFVFVSQISSNFFQFLQFSVFLLWSDFEVIDVELQANEGESSMTNERFQQVFEFVQTGNQAFRRKRFEEVINWIHLHFGLICGLIV